MKIYINNELRRLIINPSNSDGLKEIVGGKEVAYLVATPRGTFRIVLEFETRKQAVANGFGYYFTHEEYDIYAYHCDEYHCLWATVKRGDV